MMARYNKNGNWIATIEGLTCEHCKNEFVGSKHGQRFCSKSCSTKATAGGRVTHTTRNCPTCQKKWSAPPSNPSQFCSRDCLRAEWKKKRERVCVICDTTFHAKRAGHKGLTCSVECRSILQSKNASGRSASDETRKKQSDSARLMHSDPEWREQWLVRQREWQVEWHKDPKNAADFAQRSSERMKKRHQDPEWQKVRNARSSRVMKENWAQYREEYTQRAAEQYQQMERDGTGLLSEKALERKLQATKWIMKRANEALHSETEYNEVYAAVQARIRIEQPFEEGDYIDYCRWLGTQVVNSPECREIADGFLSGAIPRFAAQWQNKKPCPKDKP